MLIRSTLCAGLLLLSAPLPAAPKPPKVAKDAPYCAPPGTVPLFVSAMGEPFRGTAGHAYPVAAWLAAADTNRDGGVDRVEFVADARRFFQKLDRDHDGRLTPEEVIAYEHEVAPEIALYARGPRPGDGPDDRSRRGGSVLGGGGEVADYGGPMGAGRYAWLNIPEPVVAADADVDRIVTEREFLAAAGRRFTTLDPQAHGTLRLANLPRTPAQVAIEGPCQPRPKRQPRRDETPRRRADGTYTQ